jgi:hypothetical protein
MSTLTCGEPSGESRTSTLTCGEPSGESRMSTLDVRRPAPSEECRRATLVSRPWSREAAPATRASCGKRCWGEILAPQPTLRCRFLWVAFIRPAPGSVDTAFSSYGGAAAAFDPQGGER